MYGNKIRRNINFSPDLINQADDLVKELKIDFSKLVREALKYYLQLIRRERIAKELKEEAIANDVFYKNMRKDYKDIEVESWQ